MTNDSPLFAEALETAAPPSAAPLPETPADLARRIHELTTVNQRLGSLERFLDSIVENLPDMVFVKDARELRFVRVNKWALEYFFGLPLESVLGRNDYDFFPKEEADFFIEMDRRVLTSGQMLEIPAETAHTFHGPRVMHTKKIPIFNERGEAQYLLGIARDITERETAKQELQEKNRLLEESIRAEREALAALRTAQGALVQAEKMAALGKLVAGVAHEINNPLAFVSNDFAVLQRDFKQLNGALGMYQSTDAVLEKAAPETLRQIREFSGRVDLPYVQENLVALMTRSRDGLKRIGQIVRDLRDFSRQEAIGDLQEAADLNAGIKATVNIVQGLAKNQHVELLLELSPLPGIYCFPSRINQVVLNLLTNAIDACEFGGKITLGSRAVDGGAEIWVKDNGCGIDEEVRSKMFDPFFTTKPQGKGTGLGLSISHGIIADHGGKISVESAPGAGTCFRIFLPLTPPPDSAAAKLMAKK